MSSDSQTEILIISRSLIRPSLPSAAVKSRRRRQIHLNQWDLNMLSVAYIQKGILLPAPNNPPIIIPKLIASFTQTLDLFYPFAGRLSTVRNHGSPPSLHILLDCNDAGAEFIHAAADGLVAGDITSSIYTPNAVRSLFPLNEIVNYDGHINPLLAVQATVLADGCIFLGVSLNHAVADGYSFWHFFNAWSAATRKGSVAADSGEIEIEILPPVVERWFLRSTPPPIMLPYLDESEFIRREPPPATTRECYFEFSQEAVARLKAKANGDMGVTNISALQSLLAHMWRGATRSRVLEPGVETTYVVIVGQRQRVTPPLPDTYMGNTALGAPVIARAGELAGNDLGWAAWRLNRALAIEGEERSVKWLEQWAKNPSMLRISGFSENNALLITGSSPRFNVYGNDFGWGPPETVRSGGGNKFDGKVTVFPGREGAGSMALEVCLTASALGLLLADEEFMSAVDTCRDGVIL